MGLDYLGPLILFTCLNSVFDVTVPCNETYLAKNGHRCYPCSAGNYIVSDCVIDGEQPRCRPCGYGEYLPTCDDSTKCYPCDLFCHGGQVQIKACTPTSNLQCQCKDGYYWKPDPHRICTKHRKCNPGEGLKTKGTPYEDTICEPCKNGTSYSNLTSFNECTPCSVCNITQRSCNNIHDTVCGSKAKGTTNTPEADNDKSLVIALGVVGGVIFVVVFFCIRHRRNQNRNTGNDRVQTSSNISNGRVNIPSDSQSTKNSDKRSPDLTNPQQNGFNCLRNVRNDTNNKPTSSYELRDEGVSKNYKQLEGKQSLKNHDKDDECCINMTDNNAAYTRRSGSKAADPSVPKGSLNGQANEERSTERITAHEINKNFEEKKFEPDSKTDKTYSTEQISFNSDSNISETEAHDVNVNVNDDSKGNGTLSHTSIDAGGVPSRHVQPVASSLQSSRDKTTETNGPDHINMAGTGCTTSLVTVTSVRSDGNGQSDNGNGTISSDKHCYEVFTFMSKQLKWNTFLKFYRRLIADTDSKALSNVEADIENTRQEWHHDIKEVMYRLMNNWKQRNPNATMQSIVEALDKCEEKLMSEKLMSFINNHTKTDKVNGALKSDIVPYMGERYARGELSTSVLTMKELCKDVFRKQISPETKSKSHKRRIDLAVLHFQHNVFSVHCM